MIINGLSLKLTAPIVLISVLAIGLTAFLNLGKFTRSFDEIERSRIDFVVGDLRNNLETGLDLGLRLSDLANAQAALNSQAGADPEIVSISLFDADGGLVFHTGAALPAGGQSPAWRGNGQISWRLLEDDAQIVGTRLASAIGTVAGSLVLRYSRQHRDQVLRDVSTDLLLASLIILLLTAGLAILVISHVVRETNRKLQQYVHTVNQS